jgi:sterol 3beta-glucosyltransferase
MKVTLLTLGTRGDVQPYVNLAKGLKNHGHEVVLSTGRNFESMAKQNGIDFAPVDADFQALINSEEGKAIDAKSIPCPQAFGKHRSTDDGTGDEYLLQTCEGK